jgi:oligopeptide/dipeptide ABC transporter ATP-binding protein
VSTDTLLSVRGLTTVLDLPTGPAAAVNDVSFDIRAGETLCLVGESGSGKSLAALSILRVVPPPGRIAAGELLFKGADLLTLTEEEMQQVRGAEIGLVFQEPMSALNPVLTVGEQMAELLIVHGRAETKADARTHAIELLRKVRMSEPERQLDEFAHQLSGGLRQRATIALAIACSPSLLIADEPTTALDVTIQAQVLDLLREMRDAFGLGLLLITHDLGVVAQTADRVAVMYAGKIVEQAHARDLFHDPKHPYTRGLLASLPGGQPGTRLTAITGTVPELGDVPPGCPFWPRCPNRFDPCDKLVPALSQPGLARMVRCYLHSPVAEPPSEFDVPASLGPVL